MACGHPVTRDAAREVLHAGGNAFDAAAAALWAACVAEPVLASLGGGGFLLARPLDSPPTLYDFFTHTPRTRHPGPEDFREIHADFGSAQQAFHIGLGAAATPGMVAGIFRFHAELGRLPMGEVMVPAIQAAREGVEVNPVGAYLLQVLSPILTATPGARDLFAPTGTLLAEGASLRQEVLADLLEALGREGPDLFYRGEVAQQIAASCRTAGGHLTLDDLTAYRVERREPLATRFQGSTVWSNPPPASGGLLVSFALAILDDVTPSPGAPPLGEADRVVRLARALWVTQEARLLEGLEESVDDEARRILSAPALEGYRELARRGWRAPRGTTHISILDGEGGAASVTVSNGEGCGWVVPGGGFMLNNMLGEEDLQPRGFGRWPEDRRLTSMMTPTLVEGDDGTLAVLGSGGSNRIRSALTRVLQLILEARDPLQPAVDAPRVHVEGNVLEVEGGLPPGVLEPLLAEWPEHRVWDDSNLFFGGVHAVQCGPSGLEAAGDPRRGGVTWIQGGSGYST